jgi:hypothetical protein
MRALLLVIVMCGSAAAGTSIEVLTATLPWAILHTAYDMPIATRTDPRCPEAEILFSLAAGKLPEGLEVGLDGIHGTPRQLGSWYFTLRAANGCTQTTRALTLVVTGKPILRVDAEELVFEHRSGVPDPPARSLLVSSTWPSLPYTVNSGACAWLKFTQTEGQTPPTESALTADPVWVHVSPRDLAPGRYTCNLTFSTWRAANSPVVRVRLEVLGSPATPLL